MSHEDKCMYCNSSSYGTGCAYGPKGIHVHPQNAGGKCIYCGSSNIGSGCAYNPFGKNHVRGVDYNAMVKEAAEYGLTLGYLLRRLSKPIMEWDAYKVGLIDERGNIKRKPALAIEKNLLSKADIYVLRLKQMLSEAEIDILNNSIYLKKLDEAKPTQKIIEQYELEVDTEYKIKENIDQLQKIISEANNLGLDISTIEKLIVKAFR